MITSPASQWSIDFFAQLEALGVRHVVISPGSRSQALTFAAHALSEGSSSTLDVHVSVDERTAGFLALGLTVNSGVPSVLVCTSGSAPAHYLPALLEAKHSGLPLIVVSADRPDRLHGVGANQTSNHLDMFRSAAVSIKNVNLVESHARSGFEVATDSFRESVAGAVRGRSGPVHINVQIDEPLSSPLTDEDIEMTRHSVSTVPDSTDNESLTSVTLSPAEGTLVIAGHRAGPEAEALAVSLGAPLIAEVHSGAHMGPHLVVAYREVLSSPPSPIHRVVTVGRPTLTRPVQALLERTDIEQVVWQRGEPEVSNPSRSARVVDEVAVEGEATKEQIAQWVRPWVEASREIMERDATRWDPSGPDVALSSGSMKERAQFAEKELSVFRTSLTRRNIAQSVWSATWPHDYLVLGSSRMIREFDAVVPGKKLPVWSSRGLSGIDGSIATTRGISIDRAREDATGVTRAVVGDLTFLHDAGSLLMDSGESESAWVQIVVVRDGGGSIFDTLEARQGAKDEAFERVMFTPVSADVASLAGAYGWSYRAVTTLGELSEALLDSRRHLIIDATIAR